MSKAHDSHACTCPSGDGSLRWPCPVHPALLPCPFCGASANGYAIEPHQHSAALLALVPKMPKEHHGSYVIEGDCQCGSGLIGDNQAEVTARWNARAPLKTAEGAYPALPKSAYPAQFDGHGGEQSSDESYSAEQMRAYAAQAVAAQAAPEEVAVPDGSREAFEAWAPSVHMRIDKWGSCPDLYDDEDAVSAWQGWEAGVNWAVRTSSGEPVAYRVMRLSHDGKWTSDGRQWHDGTPSSELVADINQQPETWRIEYALAATPALPATEDSSAGDLARVDDLAALVARLAHSLRQAAPDHDLPQEAMDYLARHGIAPSTLRTAAVDLAEVQAEPVAMQMCSELRPRTESEKAAYLAGVADGRMYAERDAAKQGLEASRPADKQDGEANG